MSFKFNKTIDLTILFFLGYGIINFIPTFGIQIAIPVVCETTEVLWFNLPLSTFLDLVFAPPFTIIVIYYIRKAITEVPGPKSPEPNQMKRKAIGFLLYGSGVVLVAGIVMHAVANLLSGMSGIPIPPETPLDIAIYWFDEVLGHKLIHMAIIGVFISCFVLQYWHRRDPEMLWFQYIGTICWATFGGAVYSLALAEGQAAFEFLIISIILIVIILLLIVFKRFNLKNNIFTAFILTFLITIVISLIIYGVLTGILPGYPFFYQPN